jgi:ATP-dependent helicase YprA (DUF1998 family)
MDAGTSFRHFASSWIEQTASRKQHSEGSSASIEGIAGHRPSRAFQKEYRGNATAAPKTAAKDAGEAPRTRAIVIYPMNALANSQMKELEKFLDQSELPDRLRPTFARYTGQESQEERERIREAKPDILLTNFMMLELLMTRQSALDRAVISNAEGLDYVVLDELHTYRGRQGADVAMLVRRVRDRLCRQREPICIGTSATMASEGVDIDRATAVARVASRLFGTAIGTDAVIDESLERATDPSLKSARRGCGPQRKSGVAFRAR